MCPKLRAFTINLTRRSANAKALIFSTVKSVEAVVDEYQFESVVFQLLKLLADSLVKFFNVGFLVETAADDADELHGRRWSNRAVGLANPDSFMSSKFP